MTFRIQAITGYLLVFPYPILTVNEQVQWPRPKKGMVTMIIRLRFLSHDSHPSRKPSRQVEILAKNLEWRLKGDSISCDLGTSFSSRGCN